MHTETARSWKDIRPERTHQLTLPEEDGRDPCPMAEDPGWPSGCSIVKPAPPAAEGSGAPHPPLLAATPLPLGDAEAGAPTATPLSAATVAQDLARDA